MILETIQIYFYCSINENRKLTDESVPALKEMIQTSAVSYMGFVISFYLKRGSNPYSWRPCYATSISIEAEKELKVLLAIPVEKRAEQADTQKETENEEQTKKRVREDEEDDTESKKKKKNENESNQKKSVKKQTKN